MGSTANNFAAAVVRGSAADAAAAAAADAADAARIARQSGQFDARTAAIINEAVQRLETLYDVKTLVEYVTGLADCDPNVELSGVLFRAVRQIFVDIAETEQDLANRFRQERVEELRKYHCALILDVESLYGKPPGAPGLETELAAVVEKITAHKAVVDELKTAV
jgi:hypothetical protein